MSSIAGGLQNGPAGNNDVAKKLLIKVILFLILVPFVIITAFPFIWTVLTSFKTTQEVAAYPIVWIPAQFNFDNYAEALERFTFVRYFMNSLIVAAVVTVSQVIFSLSSGFAFAKYDFKFKNIIFYLILSGTMIPMQLKIIPTYFFVDTIGLIDTLTALILPALMTPFGIFMLRQYMSSLPTELMEAARIDGCGEFKILTSIMTPLCKAPIATLVIIVFMSVWNDFLWPLIAINSTEKRTLQLGLALFQSDFGATQYNLLMAATLLTMLPLIILYMSAQKYFVQSISQSGIKG